MIMYWQITPRDVLMLLQTLETPRKKEIKRNNGHGKGMLIKKMNCNTNLKTYDHVLTKYCTWCQGQWVLCYKVSRHALSALSVLGCLPPVCCPEICTLSSHCYILAFYLTVNIKCEWETNNFRFSFCQLCIFLASVSVCCIKSPWRNREKIGALSCMNSI